MMFDRRLLESFDWPLVLVTMLLAAAGLLTLYSAVGAAGGSESLLYFKQFMWFGLGLVAMVVVFLFHYSLLERYAFWIWLLAVGLLAWVLVFGQEVSGSRRWIHLGPVSLQPSEFAKLAVIIMLARTYSRRADEAGLTLRDLIKPFIWVGVPFVLILREPDLGTALLLLLIAGSMTLFVKIRRRTLMWLAIVAATVAVPVFLNLHEYQRQRIYTFVNPDRDPLGAGYHIIQSKIAIGSGMLTGKGYLEGTQKALRFLPEQHTDFIFSVLAEEWGFLGSSALIMLFMLLLLLALNVAHQSRDPFGAIVAVGIACTIFWQVFINIGMVMGLMPVVGVPLPLVSYGGSSVLATMLGIGLLLNISMRRFMFE